MSMLPEKIMRYTNIFVPQKSDGLLYPFEYSEKDCKNWIEYLDYRIQREKNHDLKKWMLKTMSEFNNFRKRKKEYTILLLDFDTIFTLASLLIFEEEEIEMIEKMISLYYFNLQAGFNFLFNE